MFPNLFIVGAMKCATNAIFSMLSNTPGISMCPVKEPNHFCADLYDYPDFPLATSVYSNWVRDEKEYLALFANPDARWAGEASHTYLYSRVAAQRICAFNPDSHIVIALRNPIERAYSEYLWRLAGGAVSGSFSEVIRADFERVQTGQRRVVERYLASGMYAAQVERYLERFPRRQVLAEVIDRPGVGFGQMHLRLSAFLGVDVPASEADVMLNQAQATAFPRLNRFLYRTGVKRVLARTLPDQLKPLAKRVYYRSNVSRHISEPDLSFLREVFRDDVDRLSSLIGEDLSFWLASKPNHSPAPSVAMVPALEI